MKLQEKTTRTIKSASVKAFLSLYAALGVLAVDAQQAAPARSPLLRNRPPAATSRRGGNAAADAAADAAKGEEAMKKFHEGLEKKELNIEDAPIAQVLMMYGEHARKTVIPSPELPKVNITFHSLPGDELTDAQRLEILDVLLTMNGVVLEPRGDKFLRALPRKTVRTEGIPVILEMNGLLPEEGKVVSQLITFRNILATEAQKALEGFKNPNGLFQVFERTNAILVTDTQENINRMLEITKTLDVATPVTEDVFVRQIEHATAANIKAALEAIVTESQKQTEADKSSSGPKQSGGPGFGRTGGSSSSQPRLLNNNNRPGVNNPEPAATPNETMMAAVSDADRGMIRGKVLILDDERSNKLIIITSAANMKFFDKVIETLDVETTPEVQVEVIRLKYAEAEDVSSMLNDLIGNGSSSSSSTAQNAPANRGTGGNQTLTGRQGGNRNQPQNNNRAASAQNNQLGELSKDNIKILADKRINGIVVMARKSDMKAIKDVIENMDVRLSQVLIETCIIEVSLGDNIATGMDWVQRGKYKTQVATGETDEDGNPIYETKTVRDGFFNRGGANAGYMLGGGGGSGTDLLRNAMNAAASNATDVVVNPIGSGINYLLKSDRLNIAAVIQASKSDSHAKYLASPIVMTLDNKEASIEATQMRYLLTGYTYSGSTYNGTTVPNYEQKQLGITIKVTPKINPNGTVMLTVEEEYSQEGAEQEIQSSTGESVSKVTVPTTVTRKMSADILLDNRQTVILGGLTETSYSTSETGIPLLKDIPWIGKYLFGSTKVSENRKELLIFMTPYVLDSSDMAQAEAMRRKKAMSDVRPWDDNGWSGSNLADPVSQREQLRRMDEEWKRQDDERRTRIELEKAKVERIEKLRAMTQAEQSYWLKLHEDELKKDAAETEAEQQQLRELVDSIRARRLDEAEKAIGESEQPEIVPMTPVSQPEAPEPLPEEPAADPAESAAAPTLDMLRRNRSENQ